MDGVRACPVSEGVGWLEQGFLVDPYPQLSALRDEAPVFYDRDLDHWIVTRYADVEACLLDRTTFLAENASSPIWPPVDEAQRVLREHGYKRVPTLNNADPPRHAPMRKAVLACMSPRRLRALEPEVRSYARGLVEAIVGGDEADLVAALTFPLPGWAGLSLLGIPESDFEQVKAWSAGRVLFTYGRLPADDQVRVAHNVTAFWRYAEDFVADRDAARRDDFTSDLLRYHDEHPDVVTGDDVVNIVYSMALAGHDSTTNAMGNALRHLLTHRDQWDLLVQDPALVPDAVEESLRFDGPVLGHRRTAAVDTEIGGTPVPAGARLVLLFAAAGHDPAHFPEPDALDVRRSNAGEHLAFGRGVHFCLGAPLARMELRIALELLTELTPEMHLVPGRPLAYSPNALFRSVEHLHVHP
ncbi:MAG TPA: cytochrome P450 [Acidimicrobiales bacterium]|nr:cytochrome P450 [Acidimicrobiales bacterium]